SDVQLVHCKRLIHTSLQRVLRPRDPHPLPTRRSSDLRRPKAVVNMASITAACAKNPRLTEPSCTSVLLPSRSAGLSKQIEQLQAWISIFRQPAGSLECTNCGTGLPADDPVRRTGVKPAFG